MPSTSVSSASSGMEKESSSPSSVWMVTVLIVASRMVPVMVCCSAVPAVSSAESEAVSSVVPVALVPVSSVASVPVSSVASVSESVSSVVSSVESEPDSSSVVTVSTLLWFVSELLSVSEEQAAKENSISDASNTAKRFFIEKTPFCMIRYGPPVPYLYHTAER